VARRSRHNKLANRNTSSRLSRESMADGIATGTLLTFFGNRAGAFTRITPIGLNLRERSHGKLPLH
jgi:hypothetical protein